MVALLLELSSLDVEPLETEAEGPNFERNSSLYNITIVQEGVGGALIAPSGPVADITNCCCCCGCEFCCLPLC